MRHPKLFMVLSSGYCGSLWLAGSLDRHPSISCSCGPVGIYRDHDSGFEFGRYDPGIIHRLLGYDEAMVIDEHLDKVIARKPALVAGDVHGWRVSTFLEAKASSQRSMELAHLVRHPVPLLERMTLEYIHRYKSFPRVQQVLNEAFPQLVRFVQPILAGMEWDLEANDFRGLAFLYALRDLIRVFDEMESGKQFPVWAFEDISNSREKFAGLVDFLGQGAVSASNEQLDAVFDPENLKNSGRFRKTGVSMKSAPKDVFFAWAEHEQEAFRRAARMYDLRNLYQRVGYDFEFASLG